jgi:ATP-dependent Clp protease protease subunit
MANYWKFINKADSDSEEVELRIEGDIISDDDAWIAEWLGIKATTPNLFKSELANHKGKPITVWIDSYGGDVFAAAGIYNALQEHDAAVTVKIDGKAMSAASIIAMAGDSVMMSPVALMMIHNPLTYAEGDMHDLRHVADVLDTVKESIVNAYQLKTGKQRSKISEMMDNETWMSAKSAVNEKFADGMLYEKTETVANMAPTMLFDRNAIQNHMKAANKRLIDLDRQQNKPPDSELVKAKLALTIES